MNTKISPLLSSYKGRFISSFALFLCLLGQGIKPSWAEGSKELVSDGGDRPYLEWSDRSTANVSRKPKLQVYVQVGEIVNLGSSVVSSFSNPQDIVYTSPFGTDNGTCDVDATTGLGFIDTVAKETAGPLPNVGGYTPCKFTAKETGIYTVEFHAPVTDGTNVDPPPIAANAQFSTGAAQGMGVAAWDITVRDKTNTITQKGRVFTKYIALNMGANSKSLNAKLYIQTKDGYRYETDMNGVDPFAFIFFANSRGYIDQTNNSTLYHSAGGASNNNLIFPGNVKVQDPSVADTPTNITHLVFFNPPDTTTLNALSIPITAILPVEPNSFKFTGGTGGSGNQTRVGVGGYFSFNTATNGSYQIIIDTNNDDIYDASTDRVLQNLTSVGSNVVFWDGKDANKVNLQPLPNNGAYKAIITARAGEYHFPMLDAENNPQGFKITMQNPPGPFSNFVDLNGQQIGTTTVYYNDSNYTTADGTTVNLNATGSQVATNPRNAARGINSVNGEHEFSNNYGDFKGIDTWTYFSSKAVMTPLVITTNNQANVKGIKSVRFLTDNDGNGIVTVGDTVEYTITYSNLNPGNSDAINFVINDTLPPQLSFVSAAITTATTGNNITLNSGYQGSGAVTNSGTLRVGDTITIKISGKINNANGGNSISNQANATFNTPDNPSGTVGTVLTDANSAGATTSPPTLGSFFPQIANDNVETGNNPNDTADDEPTLFTVVNVVSSNPQLLLVKRITAINGTTINQYVDDTTSTEKNNDNNPNWPTPLDPNSGISTFLRGVINGGTVKPNDELEYTIYFLSSGDTPITNVNMCDLVPDNVTFLPSSFTGNTPTDQGLPGADSGIALTIGSTTKYLTNVVDAPDRGQYFPAGMTPPSSFKCSAVNTNGAVLVNIVSKTTPSTTPSQPDEILPNATTPGTPNSYGFIRFRAKVK
jgi:uncharacterized repeat protein (TIGR01451 family)